MRRSTFSIAMVTSLLLLPGLYRAMPAAKQRSTIIPSGTEIQVRIVDKLDTGETHAGQTFTATVADPVVVGGRTVLARGQRIVGRVTEAVSSGHLKQPASITLELTSVETEPLRIDGKSHWVRNAELIGGGAAAGALLGALADGKKGAAIGAAIGGGAGATGAYLTGKKEIVIPAETQLTFVTRSGASSTPVMPAASEENKSESREQPRSGEGREEYRSSTERAAYGRPVFSSRDREVIREYFAGNYENLPPGLAKRGGNLPPGLERHLERDGTLSPGLEKRVEPFPANLERRLTPLPSGVSRVVLAGRALILDRNNKILDLMVLAE